uniref:Trans-cinnamate 4-monooxygenase n=1 Tax=Cucumis sativus TaxID=3659 RepID=A0A0A0LHE8_CUCSA
MASSSKLPPGPLSIPIFGNWLQVGNDLNHRLLASLCNRFGSIFLLKLGSKNLVVVSDAELANQVLHAQGVEFGSRPRNVVFDIFTGNGQDMVFTVYGDHWRKMRRIMTLPFFTNKVVHNYSGMWEDEMDFVYVVDMIDLIKFYRKIMAANGDKHKITCAMDHIIDAQVKGEISEENVIYIVENINVAAIETTLWSMEWAIAELVNHPEIQHKIRRSCPGIVLAMPILGLIVAKLVSKFEMKPPSEMNKIDVTEKGGQFSLHIANHSTVVFNPITI